MTLTQEQISIIRSDGDIKINAVAGSGKTTTVIEYAKTRPKNSKILYLAFNKTVRMEAVKKFADQGLDTVRVETAHSLAYKHIVFKHQYKLKSQGYKTHEIAELLGLKGTGEKHAEYIIANHINKFITYFCNSDKLKVQDLNYTDTITDPKAKTFVTKFYNYIESQTRLLLAKMDKGELEITHDFYLKKFQLSNPVLDYDYILFDEGQDASAAMLDVFFRQKAKKVIVGDTYQQIYGWRYAVNSLEKTNFKTYHLSTSFRFGQDIADLGKEVIGWKTMLGQNPDVIILGHGNTQKIKTKAVIARTNLGLLLKAIEYVTEKKNIKSIYFEGNINSYTYAEEGASLYDVLNLFNRKNDNIKDKLIATMTNMSDLEEYIEKTEDVQLGMMVEIVKEYGNKIYDIMNSIKEKHLDHDDKSKAEIIFSTVHRCKGMEYDSVELVNDFITEEKLEKLTSDVNVEGLSYERLSEEINLLYVAITRTKKTLYIPAPLMPDGFPESKNIFIQEIKEKTTKTSLSKTYSGKDKKQTPVPSKKYVVADLRKNHQDAYKSWTHDLDDELREMYGVGMNIKDLARYFDRTQGSIKARIAKLGLEE